MSEWDSNKREVLTRSGPDEEWRRRFELFSTIRELLAERDALQSDVESLGRDLRIAESARDAMKAALLTASDEMARVSRAFSFLDSRRERAMKLSNEWRDLAAKEER